ncbi:MAG: undecaprenyl-diphosphate phosphatase [Acidobacteria bacterium]|nr:MAG: undecaprenyl-diphosphate phosphatase [Acidobacteriota bacterium]
MLNAILWGFIQGMTEFLPVSSSGHLVLIPALLDQSGPDLATSAMLHLGTLTAVVVYYRSDISAMLKFDRPGRRLVTLIAIGSVPAVVVGLLFKDQVEDLIGDPRKVAAMMIVTGVVLLSSTLLRLGEKSSKDIGPFDGLVIGLAQALALIPGISRSGMTITAGLTRGMSSIEAARFAFLLGIPVIAGAGLLSIVEVISSGESIPSTVWIGVVVAGFTGYAAISILLRLLQRIGLAPFGIYCVAFGSYALVVL